MNPFSDHIVHKYLQFSQRYTHVNCVFDNNPISKMTPERRFYEEISTAMGVRSQAVTDLGNFVEMSVKRIHIWDKLIDEKGIDPHLSREKAFQLDKTCAYDALSPNAVKEKELLPYYSLEMSFEEINLILKMDLDLSAYIEYMGKAYDNIERYFYEEKLISNKDKLSKEEVIKMLVWGNCDFYAFNEVMYRILQKEGIHSVILDYLNKFLREYLIIDLIADHIADLKEDLKNGSYNLLLLWHKTHEHTIPSWPQTYERLSDSGTFSQFWQLAEEAYNRAMALLGHISIHPLHDLLLQYLTGEIDGIRIFRDLNNLVDIPIEQRERLTLFLMKPHPWERIGFQSLLPAGCCSVDPATFSGVSLDRLEAQRIIKTLMHKIREDTITCLNSSNLYCNFPDPTPDYFNGGPCKRNIIKIASSGCRYGASSQTSCTHCAAFAVDLRTQKLTPTDILKLFTLNISSLNGNLAPILCLYVNGNFLDPDDLDRYTRTQILSIVESKDKIRKVVIECRPELVSPEEVEDIRKKLPSKEIEVGLGFDSASKTVRELCLNKPISLTTLETAIQILHRHKIKALVYVVVKPPFLTSTESIKEAIRTVNLAFDIGADSVSLEPMVVQDHTLIHYLYQHGTYTTPSLWDIVTVIRKTYKRGIIKVGGEVFDPTPYVVPVACGKCDNKVRTALQAFSCTQKIGYLNDLICECYKFSINGEKYEIPEDLLIERIIEELRSEVASNL